MAIPKGKKNIKKKKKSLLKTAMVDSPNQKMLKKMESKLKTLEGLEDSIGASGNLIDEQIATDLRIKKLRMLIKAGIGGPSPLRTKIDN
tara:strand:+ start:1219 stop:1485 length:267 start_codon:yes stop_codon:yes gene_type:complete